MGGAITLQSAPGQGSTFRFSIGLPRAAEADQGKAESPDLSGQAVLFVAPGAIEAPLVAARLRRFGAHVDLATDEMAARAILSVRAYNAIMVDRALGRDAARALAGAGSAARRIVLLTPSERPELTDLKAAGFTSYLVKPVRAASLAARFTAAVAVDADMADEPAIEPPIAPGAALAVLVAEDNDINALLARALLHRLGHNPVVVGNGALALEAFTAAAQAGTPYDVVLMDVHMPELDGLEATRHIRAAEAAMNLLRTRIVALTANAFDEDRDACLAAGMDDFLMKPLDRDRLAEILTERSALAA
jgi:CheY-like chemotaxis protein